MPQSRSHRIPSAFRAAEPGSACRTAAARSRGAWIGSRFLNNLGFVKAVFGAQIGIDRIVMSAICPPIANSYHLSLITLRVSS
jgi:hypothetical protein